MPDARKAAAVVAGLRIAYGAALLITPPKTTKRWLGSDAQRPGGAQVAVRALGAREIVLHAGALAAALTDAPVRPWLLASFAGDCADIASTWAAKGHVPDGSPLATAVVAGGSAALTAAVAATLES
jgi:hypothetical protein